MSTYRQTLKVAFPKTIPVLCGYLFLGAGFGVLLSKSGYHFLWAPFTSLTVYGGSMQYVTVDLLNKDFDITNAIIMTLAVNIRHVFYGLSLIEPYKGMGLKKFYCIFGLTDETFSLVCSQYVPEHIDKGRFYFVITLLNHVYWIVGCTLGAIIGQYVDFNSKGIEFVMTALFVVIFLEQWESSKEHSPALIGLGASLFCLIITKSFIPAAFNFFLIPSMVFMFILLAAFRKPIERRLERCTNPR